MNQDYSIIAYKPPRYSHLECRIFNLISRKKIKFILNVGTQEASFCLTLNGQNLPYRGTDPLTCVDLAFEAREEVWQVWLEKTRCLYALIEMGDDSGFFKETPPESLPREVLWAVVEAFIGQGVGRVEQILRSPVKIVAPDESIPVDCFNIPFELVFGDGDEMRTNGSFQVPLRQTCVELLETLFADFPGLGLKPQVVNGLKTTIFFQAGSMELPLNELKAMEVGDVLIPDLWYPDQEGMVVCIPPNRFMCKFDQETLTVAVKVNDGSPEFLSGRDQSMEKLALPDQIRTDQTRTDKALTDQPLTNKNDKLGKEKMTQENLDVETTYENGVKGLEDLDISLVFEIGRTTRTLVQINELVKGAVIELPGDIKEGVLVDIKANDQLIARGKIVGIGDGLGVQITQQAKA